MEPQEITTVPGAAETADKVPWLNVLLSLREMVNYLMDQGPIVMVLVMAVGVVALLLGWKLFKVVVVANATCIGGLVGMRLGSMVQGPNMPLIGMIAGGLLLAVLAMPLMKYAVSLMGALAGAFAGYGLWDYVASAIGTPEVAQYAWAGALIGLVTLGLLAFVIFRMVIMIFTSFQGAVMVVAASLSLLVKYVPASQGFHDAVLNNIHLPPLLITVPAVIGFALQHNAANKKGPKKGAEGR